MIVAVEVVAKLGDSIIEIARVERGESYSSPLVPFPLVCGEPTGFVVHRPVGVLAWRRGAAFDDTKLALADSDSLVLAIGRVTLYVLPILERAALVPKQRPDRRPFVYGAVVLVAHLFVWGLAEARYEEPIEIVAKPLPMRRVHVAHVEPPPPPPEHPPAVVSPPSAGPVAKGRARKRSAKEASSGEAATLGAFGDVSMLIPSVDVVALVNESVWYDAQAAEEAKFGGSGGRFDPFRECRPNCGVIPAGPYETISFRKRRIPQIAITSDDAAIEAAARGARAALVACHDGDAGSVRVVLRANASGVYALRESRGLDAVGPCVGAVIDALHLTGTTNATASITIAFRF